MHPDEEWRLAVFIQPDDCMRNDITGAALDGVITVLAVITFDVETSIEKTKAAIESRRHASLRIKDDRANECGCVIAAPFEDLRHVRQQRRQRMAEICHGVKLRICAGKNRGV